MIKEYLINNLKDLKTELVDHDIYKGSKAFVFLDTIDAAINLALNVYPICSTKILNKEFLLLNDKNYEDIIKESLAHDLAIYLKDKMDITISDYPSRQELTYIGKIYIYDKKKGEINDRNTWRR